MHLRLVGHQLGQQPRQPDGLGAQVRRESSRVTRARRVPLVEDQVDDREHRRAGGPGSSALARHAVGDPGGADLALGPHQPLGHGWLRHEEGPRDLRRSVSPPSSRRVRATCAAGAERRVAAGEDQAEPVVGHGPVAPVAHCLAIQQRCLRMPVVAGGLAAEPVDRPVPGGSDDPAGRTRRQSRPTAIAAPPRRTRPGRTPRRCRCHRTTRMSTATARPYSLAEDPLDLGLVDSSHPRQSVLGFAPGTGAPRRAAPQATVALRCPRECCVEVRGLDDPEAADVLLALGERPVGEQRLAIVNPYNGGGARRVQPAGEHPHAGPCSSAFSSFIADISPASLGRRRRCVVNHVHAEQVLLRPCPSPAGT